MARLPSMTSNPRHIPQSRKRFAHQWNACIDSMSVLICTHDEERLSLSLKCPFSSPSLQFASTRSLAALSTTFTNCARQRICHCGFFKQPVTPDPAKRCSDRYHFLVTAFSDISSEQSILLLRKQLIRPRSLGATARGPPFLPGNWVTRFSHFMSEEALGLSRQVHVCTESRPLRYKLLIVSRMALIESPGAHILGATRTKLLKHDLTWDLGI